MLDNTNNKPTIRFHEDSQLHYLLGKDKTLFETGITIDRSQFEKLKDIPGAVATLLSSNLGSSNTGFDWKFACSTGQLRRKAVKKEKVAIVEEQKPVIQQEKTPEAPPVVSYEQPKLIFSSVSLVLIVMTIVGIGSAIMSAYHTSAFLIEGGKPVWTGILTGIMFILFSGTAFTAARYFLQEKGAQKLFGVLFIAAGFTVVAYSMFSTLTVNFNQFKWVDDEKSLAAVEDSELLVAHEKLLVNNKDALDEINIEITRIEQEMDYWKTMSWRRYDEFRLLLEEAQNKRNVLRQRQVDLESSKPEIVAQAQSSRDTVYTMLARLLSLPEDVARFFIYAAPACLYDILAPFALSVILLLVDRRRKGNMEVSG